MYIKFCIFLNLQPPQAQQAPLQIQSSLISQQAVAAAAAAAQQQYTAVPVSMVETGRQMLLTVSVKYFNLQQGFYVKKKINLCFISR